MADLNLSIGGLLWSVQRPLCVDWQRITRTFLWPFPANVFVSADDDRTRQWCNGARRIASRQRQNGRSGQRANRWLVTDIYSLVFLGFPPVDSLRLFFLFFSLLFGGASIATLPFTGADECVSLITRAVCVRNEDNVTACAFVQRLQVDFLWKRSNDTRPVQNLRL